MPQAIGALLVLVGALFFHIAASDLPHSNIQDIWKDMQDIMQGKVSK